MFVSVSTYVQTAVQGQPHVSFLFLLGDNVPHWHGDHLVARWDHWLDLETPLSWPPSCWDYKCMLSYLEFGVGAEN